MKNFIPIIALALLASNVDASHHFQSKSIETFSINTEGEITFHTNNSSYTANLNNCSYQELSKLDNPGIYSHSSLMKENTRLSFLSKSGNKSGCKIKNIKKL